MLFKYFKFSFLVLIVGLLIAFLWGQFHLGGVGVKMLMIALFLAILEVTLSFDNAIVNAIRLEKMDKVWQQRFLTWGILIAVFGMRLFFPVLLVSIFSKKSIAVVFQMAINDIGQYTTYLHEAHVPLVTFGGIFLLLIFTAFFFDKEKECFWLSPVEKICSKTGNLNSLEIIIALAAICAVQYFQPPELKASVLLSGIGAIITFLLINGITEMMEGFAEKRHLLEEGCKLGLINFIYLELIDASFSFDGLLGAFAISSDIIIITVGLAIGAMFVRSLTLFMVDKKTLKQYIYLEHGAHWAIGFLAAVMMIGTRMEVPEWVTGGFSLVIIVASLISSVLHQKKEKEDAIREICEKN